MDKSELKTSLAKDYNSQIVILDLFNQYENHEWWNILIVSFALFFYIHKY